MSILAIILVVIVVAAWSVIGTLYYMMTALQNSKPKTTFERILVAPAYIIYGVLRAAQVVHRKLRRK